MSPQEAGIFLSNVSSRARNAAAESSAFIRRRLGRSTRSLNMMGGYISRTASRVCRRKENVGRDFHDTILKEGPIPGEMVRAI